MVQEVRPIAYVFSGTPKKPKEVLAGDPVAVPEKKEKSTRGRKSLKETDAEKEIVNVPADDVLFQKQYYSIGEVAAWFGVNTSLIRYWEQEFDMIEPRKNRKGDRLFKPEDVKTLQLIYDLLRRRKFTIEGAKDYLKRNQQAEERFAIIQSLRRLKSFLLELRSGIVNRE